MVIIGGGKAGGIAAATFTGRGVQRPSGARQPGIGYPVRPPPTVQDLPSNPKRILTNWYVRPPDWYAEARVGLPADPPWR